MLIRPDIWTRLYVHKDAQGKGIATALCEKAGKCSNNHRNCDTCIHYSKPFLRKKRLCYVKEQQVFEKELH